MLLEQVNLATISYPLPPHYLFWSGGAGDGIYAENYLSVVGMEGQAETPELLRAIL